MIKLAFILLLYLEEGETALHKACKMSNVKVVQRLIEYTDNKPEIDTKDYINAVNFKVGQGPQPLSNNTGRKGRKWARLLKQQSSVTVYRLLTK